jgi:hypothetical protein
MSEQVFLLAMLHCVAFLEQMLITIVEIWNLPEETFDFPVLKILYLTFFV